MRFAVPWSRSAIPILTCLAAGIVTADPGSGAETPAIERLDSPSGPLAEDAPRGQVSSAGAVGTLRFEIQGGLVRWKWNEVVPGHVQLEELGLVPLAMARGTWRKGPVLLGASLEVVSGAVEYDGYLQDRFDGSLIPYRSQTHYLSITPTLGLQLRVPGAWDWIRPTLSLSRPWWQRTIDSEVGRSPGRFGYVETWSVLNSGYGFELERTFRRILALTIHGEVQVPHSTSERIGLTLNPVELEPKTRTGMHWRARLTYRSRAHLEIDALATGFDESELVEVPDGSGDQVYQPESSLDRVAWKVGWIF
jgi:hypothetical protein